MQKYIRGFIGRRKYKKYSKLKDVFSIINKHIKQKQKQFLHVLKINKSVKDLRFLWKMILFKQGISKTKHQLKNILFL